MTYRDPQATTVRLAIRAEMDRQEIEDRRPPGGFVNNYDQQKIAEAVVAALDASQTDYLLVIGYRSNNDHA